MSSEEAPATAVQPRRELGRWGLTAVGVSAIIGAGIYGLPASVAAKVGSAGLAAYVCAAVATVLFGHSMARLGRHHELSGGPYVYVGAAFGPFWGFQVGWFFFLTRITTLAAVAEVFVFYLSALWPALRTGAARAATMALCLAVLAVLNVVGIRQTARAMSIFAVGKVVPLMLFIAAGISFLDSSRIIPTEMPPRAAFGATVLLLVFAFGGFEHLTVPAEESRRPREHVPFGLLASIAITTLLYIGVQAVASSTLPDLGQRAAPLADSARITAGRPGFAFMIAGAIVATVGTMLVNVMTSSRMVYAFSRDGFLPPWMGALHPRFRTPALGVLLSAGLGLVLAVSGTFTRMAGLSAAARLVTYGACCAAALPLREGSRLPPLAGLAAALLLVAMLPARDWLWAGLAVILGVVIYFARRQGP